MKKFRSLFALIVALALCLGTGVVSASAATGYPSFNTIDGLVPIGNEHITALEISEMQGAYPFCYAGQQELPWMNYTLHELTTDTTNDIGAGNSGSWVTRGNNANSTSWVRQFFGSQFKIKQVVLLTPSLDNAPSSLDFIYSKNATTTTPYTSVAANTTQQQEWDWQKAINGEWAKVASFTETEWVQSAVPSTRNTDVNWNGYVKIVTFDKAVECNALTVLLGKATQVVKIDYIRCFRLADGDTTTEVANDKFYSYNYDYTVTASDNFNDDTVVGNLNDGITGNLFQLAGIPNGYGRWLSQNAVAGGHTVNFVTNSVERYIGGIALHVGSDKAFFPANFTIENKVGEQWNIIASYKDYEVTDKGWQYFVFSSPVQGEIRLNIADERFVEIAEAILLETTEAPKTVTSVSVTEGSFASIVNYGAELDFTNATLTINFSNGTAETVAITADMVSGYSSTTVGVQTVTVSYGTNVAQFEVEVKDIAISIRASLEKTEFTIGDTLDVTGATVSVLYASGEVEEVELTADMVVGFTSEAEGTITLTVNYGELSCSTEVTIVKAFEPEQPGTSEPETSESTTSEPTTSEPETSESENSTGSSSCSGGIGAGSFAFAIGAMAVVALTKKRR